MSFVRCTILLWLALLLPACAATTASPLLRKVRAVKADGTLSAPLAEKDLSPFQQLLRDRLSPASPQPTAIFALEVDVPDGTGVEGAYLAIIHSGKTAELRYFEQGDHQPRFDRYYHRLLTADETAEFDAFLKAHPLAQLQLPQPLAEKPSVSPETAPAPATAPATEAAAASATEPSTQPNNADAPAVEAPIFFRFTDAQPNETQTIVIQSPGKDDHPVTDLIQLLARFRDAVPFASTYFQSIPPTARSLYADPNRRVLYVWHEGDDLRIAVTVPQQAQAPSPENPDVLWLAYQVGQWQPSSPPPGFGTEPATASATEPATPVTAPVPQPAVPQTGAVVPQNTSTTQAALAAVLAALPAVPSFRFANPGYFPEVETWWAEPGHGSTMVRHYVPSSPTSGVTLGFVVPAFEFDDDHFAVDAARGMLYLIHDGQLFSLPIPKASLGVK